MSTMTHFPRYSDQQDRLDSIQSKFSPQSISNTALQQQTAETPRVNGTKGQSWSTPADTSSFSEDSSTSQIPFSRGSGHDNLKATQNKGPHALSRSISVSSPPRKKPRLEESVVTIKSRSGSSPVTNDGHLPPTRHAQTERWKRRSSNLVVPSRHKSLKDHKFKSFTGPYGSKDLLRRSTLHLTASSSLDTIGSSSAPFQVSPKGANLVSTAKPARTSSPGRRTDVDIDMSKVPKGPRNRDQRRTSYSPVPEVVKRSPHIFISGCYLPVQKSTIPHLAKKLKVEGCSEIWIDDTGYFIEFGRWENSRKLISDLYELYNNDLLFGEYQLRLECFPDGISKEKDSSVTSSFTSRDRTSSSFVSTSTDVTTLTSDSIDSPSIDSKLSSPRLANRFKRISISFEHGNKQTPVKPPRHDLEYTPNGGQLPISSSVSKEIKQLTPWRDPVKALSGSFPLYTSEECKEGAGDYFHPTKRRCRGCRKWFYSAYQNENNSWKCERCSKPTEFRNSTTIWDSTRFRSSDFLSPQQQKEPNAEGRPQTANATKEAESSPDALCSLSAIKTSLDYVSSKIASDRSTTHVRLTSNDSLKADLKAANPFPESVKERGEISPNPVIIVVEPVARPLTNRVPTPMNNGLANEPPKHAEGERGQNKETKSAYTACIQCDKSILRALTAKGMTCASCRVQSRPLSIATTADSATDFSSISDAHANHVTDHADVTKSMVTSSFSNSNIQPSRIQPSKNVDIQPSATRASVNPILTEAPASLDSLVREHKLDSSCDDTSSSLTSLPDDINETEVEMDMDPPHAIQPSTPTLVMGFRNSKARKKGTSVQESSVATDSPAFTSTGSIANSTARQRLTYVDIVALAILNAPDHRCTRLEILDWTKANLPEHGNNAGFVKGLAPTVSSKKHQNFKKIDGVTDPSGLTYYTIDKKPIGPLMEKAAEWGINLSTTSGSSNLLSKSGISESFIDKSQTEASKVHSSNLSIGDTTAIDASHAEITHESIFKATMSNKPSSHDPNKVPEPFRWTHRNGRYGIFPTIPGEGRWQKLKKLSAVKLRSTEELCPQARGLFIDVDDYIFLNMPENPYKGRKPYDLRRRTVALIKEIRQFEDGHFLLSVRWYLSRDYIRTLSYENKDNLSLSNYYIATDILGVVSDRLVQGSCGSTDWKKICDERILINHKRKFSLHNLDDDYPRAPSSWSRFETDAEEEESLSTDEDEIDNTWRSSQSSTCEKILEKVVKPKYRKQHEAASNIVPETSAKPMFVNALVSTDIHDQTVRPENETRQLEDADMDLRDQSISELDFSQILATSTPLPRKALLDNSLELSSSKKRKLSSLERSFSLEEPTLMTDYSIIRPLISRTPRQNADGLLASIQASKSHVERLSETCLDFRTNETPFDNTAKIEEIRKRPTRKQAFRVHLISHNRKGFRNIHMEVHKPARKLNIVEPAISGSTRNTDPDGTFGTNFDMDAPRYYASVTEMLGIPEKAVPMVTSEKKLAMRTDAPGNGRSSRAKAVFNVLPRV
ncbi:hypothetical protein M501DRAFT_1001878 [Patellaria atrata CBS 101060]|uniref:Histone lysine methyltransferase SET associated domain-containing protein n=1 Tax=Patellaria atrata CBS 101060 TaxID=1346257 RepID=A0A9P4SFU7_9PEZI|nr:hypothetical protein M501DRAFT_1001878 [Patellaria atrata CBS 101060]